ncbi:MAG: C25 family cysteine peptidase [bacterium]
MSAADLAAAGITVVRDDISGLTIVYEPRDIAIERTADPEGGVQVTAAGHVQRQKPGEPDLPATFFSFGMPASGDARITIESVEFTPIGTVDVAPIADVDGSFEDYDAVYRRSAAIYSAGAVFPERVAELPAPHVVTTQRVGSVVLFPVRWNPETGEASRVARLRARIDFPGTRGAVALMPEPLRERSESRLREMLANYDTARSFRDATLAKRNASKRGEGDSFASSSDWIRVEITRTGVHRITYASLVAAGISNPTTEIGATGGIRIYNGGGLEVPEDLLAGRNEWMKQTPLLVRDGADGSFDAADEIIFYALGPGGFLGEFDPTLPDSAAQVHFRTRFANANVYWLTWGGEFTEAPKRLTPSLDGAVVPGSGATIATDFLFRTHAEEDLVEDISRFGEDGWFWNDMSNTNAGTAITFRSSSPGAIPERDAELKVRLFGHRQSDTQTFGNYRALIEWNSAVLADTIAWEDRPTSGVKYPYDFVYTGPISSGRADTLRVRLFDGALSTSSREVYMAWFELEYARRYDGLGAESFSFTSPEATGRIRYDIAGIAGTPNLLIDVTDPFEARLVGGGVLASGVFSFERPEDAKRRYVLTGDGALLAPSRIARFQIDNLRDPSIRADYLIVVADELRSSVEQIRALRARDFTVRVVPLSQINAQFGWGVAQPAAIRDFLRYAAFNWDDGRGPGAGFVPEYVLLVGDATKDYRGIKTTGNRNLIPLYYRISRDGSPINTFGTDDYYTYLDVEAPGVPLVSIGRIPAGSSDQVTTYTSKLVEYETNPELGDWRSRIVFAADDEMKGCASREVTSPCWDRFFLDQHTKDVEGAAAVIPGVFLEEKIYMVEFPFGNEVEKPAAKRAYIDALRRGCLLSHYSGHGAYDKMADENLFFTSDADATVLGNGRRYYIFSAYSCTIGLFDRDDGSSISEQLIFTPGGGSIASVASDAPAFAGSSFIFARNVVSDLFKAPGDAEGRVGDSIINAKSQPEIIRSRTNDEKYHILGDPALRLALPELPVAIDPHPGFVGGTFATVSGSVLQGGAVASSFNGKATVTVSGVADTSGYTFFPPPDGSARRARFTLLGGTLYTGDVPVTAGRWTASFFVPADIRQGDLAQIHAYVDNGATDGVGLRDSIDASRGIEVDSTVASDQTGPELSVAFDDRPLRPNVSVVPTATLKLRLSDPHGVNIQGEDDFYSISVTMDEGTSAERTTDLTEKFEYDFGDFKNGGLDVAFETLLPPDAPLGVHTITIQASDNLNNRTKTVSTIEIVGAIGEFRVSDPLNFPNPFSDETLITYDLTQGANLVTVKLFTVNGRLVREFQDAPGIVGNSNEFVWDGRDQDGDLVANGVYFFKVIAQAADGKESEAVGRAVVMRE